MLPLPIALCRTWVDVRDFDFKLELLNAISNNRAIWNTEANTLRGVTYANGVRKSEVSEVKVKSRSGRYGRYVESEIREERYRLVSILGCGLRI